METLAEPEYWSEMWDQRALTYEPNALAFKDIFERHIPSGGDCIEIGCFPGGYLIYLSKRFDLTVHGIDSYLGMGDAFGEYLSRNGAKVGTITAGDFFTCPLDAKYDVVCSFGFIEHFPDFRSVLKKHVELIKPGGLLLVACPNFRKVQFLLHWLLDRDNLRKHVMEAMDLRAWHSTLSDCGMEVIEEGYSGTFLFWVESRSLGAVWLARHIAKFASWINKRVKRPNSLISPFMYCVARKPDTSNAALVQM